MVEKAEKTGASESLGNLFANADNAADLKEMVDKAELTGASESLGNLFANADKADELKDVVAKAEQTGSSAALGNLFANAERADDFKRVTDQLDAVGLEGGDSAVFENLVEVANVFEKVSDSADSTVDADFARNILGNADKASEVSKAMDLVAGSGGEAPDTAKLLEIAKKGVSEIEAINKVAEKLKDAGGDDAIDSFLEQGIDQALQLDKALEGNADLAANLANMQEGASFTDIVGNSALADLQSEYGSNPDILAMITKDNAQDIAFALEFVDPGSNEEAALFANLDKLDAIMDLGNRFEGDKAKLATVFSNLDQAKALSELSEELSIYQSRLDLVFENADKANAILNTYEDIETSGSTALMRDLFASSESLDATLSNQGVIKLAGEYPEFDGEIDRYKDRAAEIASLIELVGDEQRVDDIFANLDNFDKMSDMVVRFQEEPEKLNKIFDNIGNLDKIHELSNEINEANLGKTDDLLFDNLNDLETFESGFDAFKEAGKLDELNKLSMEDADRLINLAKGHEDSPDKLISITGHLDILGDLEENPEFLELAYESPEFFDELKDSGVDMKDIPIDLAKELKDLGLTEEELKVVLSDLVAGPGVEGPTTQPPADQDDQSLASDSGLLSLLNDHTLNGDLSPEMVLESELIRASSLFEDTIAVFDALSDMDYDEEGDGPDYSEESEPEADMSGVLGGANIDLKSGSYDLSNLQYEDIVIAASESLNVSGQLNITGSVYPESELILLSGETLNIEEGTSISFAGDSLGFGSLDSMEILNVDLQAEGELHARSLDSLVIKNSDMRTSGNGGADFVHLIAANELSIDNLRFSEQVREIAMQAMTINIWNVNFPAGSTVNLNSLYGGIDGKYPNFNSQVYGRVNFIENVKYNANLINSTQSFDQIRFVHYDRNDEITLFVATVIPLKMKYFYFLTLTCFVNVSYAQDANGTSSAQSDSPFLSSDFFSGALADAQAKDAEDAMGTQRLVQVKSSELTPAVALSSAFKYTSNPEKAASPTKKDGTTADLSLTFTMGLGEYGLGEEVICTPSFMFMQMRTFTDPIRDYGDEMELYDVDVLVAGLSFPFILPNDYSLTIGHTYAAPYKFRGPKT